MQSPLPLTSSVAATPHKRFKMENQQTCYDTEGGTKRTIVANDRADGPAG
ncbi:MAG TPA: hypothetical protein VGG28_32955 [Kofleriaceae bacterium]|jgi:hypothetical protein